MEARCAGLNLSFVLVLLADFELVATALQVAVETLVGSDDFGFLVLLACHGYVLSVGSRVPAVELAFGVEKGAG